MKIFLHVAVAFLCLGHLYAQENRLPSNEEVRNKEQKVIQFQLEKEHKEGDANQNEFEQKQKDRTDEGPRFHSSQVGMEYQLDENLRPVNPAIEKEKALEQFKKNKNGHAANKLYTTGPEQNCSGAINVCAQTYTQATSYTGFGTTQEVNGTCLSSQETNSVWYVFTAQTTGTFGFTLATVKDYDFALYDISTIGCAGVPTAVPVRCNFSATAGNTGMSPAGTCASCTAAQGPFSTELAVTAGQTFALIIDNYSADATGYTITFTSGGGYASITDITPPTINPPASVVNNCNGTFTLTFSEPVQCSSIAANGSDFTLTGGGVITGATGVGCTTSTLVSSVVITYTVPSSGTFTLGVQAGTDGNTLLDKCNNAMATSQTVTLNTLNALTLTASTTNICTAGTAVTLTAGGAPNSIANIYTLNPGGIVASSNGSGQATFTVNPASTTTYTVTATFAGCTKTASVTINLQTNIIVSINPVNPTLCSGTTTLTASTTINGVADAGATFQWSGGSTATTASITAGAGTYNVTTVSSAGCTGSNTATSTVSIASPGASPGCNIYYVSPAGGGNGLTKANPTTLQNALTASVCTNSIIKMQTGIYTLTDKVDVNSFVTIEGGYNAAYTTKTSNLSGGTNSTTIRRSNTADSDDATSCTAFKIASSATGFRLQDLRIELPGSPSVTALTAGSAISTYGIKMAGAGATSYNIVRCYVDAGVGALPASATYCAANGTTCDEFISNVTVGSINNTTTCSGGGYANYTTQATTMAIGTGYPISIGNGPPNYGSDQCRIWVDWNQDGDFLDASETITPAGGPATYTATITPPGGATAGSTRMRIRIMYTGAVSSCGAATFGEVEDYTIHVTAPSAAGNAYAIYSPNATSGIVDCELYATAGSSSATGCKLCSPADAGFTNVDLANQNVITVSNISCTNTTLSMTTTGASCQSLGTGATSITPALPTTSSPITFQYSSTGRKTIAFPAPTVLSAQTFSSGAIGAPLADLTKNLCEGKSTIAIPAQGCNFTGSEITVHTNITAADPGCFSIRLFTPYGNRLSLDWGTTGITWTNPNCDFKDAGTYALWNSAGSTNTSSFRPQGDANAWCGSTPNITTFSAINGGTAMNMGGNWQLEVERGNCATGAATFNSWSISIPAKTCGSYGNYTDFVNIQMVPPSPGTISGTTNRCPGTYNFASSVAGTPGYTYAWSYTTTGGSASIASATSSNTDITFTNNTGSNQTFTISLIVTSECCGPLTTVTYPVVVYPSPTAPTVASASISTCTGGTATPTATAPASSSFQWYTVATGGTAIGTAASYTVTPVVSGTTSYYVETVNSNGCISGTRTQVDVVGTLTATPTAVNASSCSPGDLTMSISAPIAGATYNWYTGSCGGSLVQSSTSTSLTANVPGVQTNTYYVSVTVSGCSESLCQTVTAQVTAAPASVFWTGVGSTGANNWFDANNWASSGNAATTFSATPGSAIGDNNCTGVSNAINVTGYSGTVSSSGISVTINIAHADDDNLDIYLTAPNGDIIELSTDNGTNSANYTNTVFSDAGATNITAGSAPFTGTYRPEGNLNTTCTTTSNRATFGAIGGGSINPNGNWTLYVRDDANTTTGTLTSWSISFPSNLSGICAPSCATNVSIPATPALAVSNPPDIGFSASGNAACKSLTIAGGNTLSFSDTKAVLEICGNYTQSGTLTTNNKGLIAFVSSTAQQTFVKTGSGDFNNVEINNTFSSPYINLSNDLQIAAAGSLNFINGIIVTGANKVVQLNTSASSVSGFSSLGFINGKMRRYIASNTSTYAFCVGDGSATSNWKRIDLVNNNLTGVSYIDCFVNSITESAPNDDATFATAAQVQNGSDLTTINQAAQWDLTPNAGPTGGSYGVRLFTANTGLTTADDNNFCAVKRPSASVTYADWVSLNASTTIPANGLPGRLYGSGSGYAERLGYTTFSKHAIAKSTGPLPVTLSSFEANCNSKVIDLSWVTESEENSDQFILERSGDGVNYISIAGVGAAGNSIGTKYYYYSDREPLKGKNYYRLILRDRDGKVKSYTPITIQDCGVISLFSAGISPNPAGESFMISIQNPEDANVKIEIFDDAGKLVYKTKFDMQKGTASVLINSENFSQGVYMVKVISNNNVANKKLIRL